MSWKNKANQHHGHKKVIHKPEAQANGMVIMLVIHKILNRIHKPEAQANGMVIMLVINNNPSLALQACIIAMLMLLVIHKNP